MEKNAICNEARITIDNAWTIYDDVPRKWCPPVQRVEKNQQVVYVVPTQSYVQGKPEAQVPLLQMQGLEVLHWAIEKYILVIGVGHDPVVIPSLMTKLKSVTDVVNKFIWHPLIPIVQPRPKCKVKLVVICTSMWNACSSGMAHNTSQAFRHPCRCADRSQ